LLVAVALFAVWLALTMYSVRTQRNAVAAIQSSGGTILYDYHESAPRTWSTAGTPRGPKWARDLLGPEYFDRVVYIGLFNTPENDAWIHGFNRLKDVKTLLLSGRHVTDQTLNGMETSESLLELHLTKSAITNDGMRALSKFPNLRWLVADNTSITDEGVIHLSTLHHLQEVHLNNTNVSEEGAHKIRALLPSVMVRR
jgi:hypothetical protein